MSTLLFITPDVSSSLALIPGIPGGIEIAVLLIIGLLIFGKRLPDVGRNLGKSIVEFKKGIKGIGDEIDSEADRPSLKEEDKSKTSKTADLPPAKVTPDPSKNVDEVKQDLDD